MPTDHHAGETSHTNQARQQMTDDRISLNIRREGIALLGRMVDQAKELEYAIATGDYLLVARFLDRQNL